MFKKLLAGIGSIKKDPKENKENFSFVWSSDTKDFLGNNISVCKYGEKQVAELRYRISTNSILWENLIDHTKDPSKHVIPFMRSLLREIHRLITANNAEKVEIYTFTNNRLKIFLEKLGFRPYSSNGLQATKTELGLAISKI